MFLASVSGSYYFSYHCISFATGALQVASMKHTFFSSSAYLCASVFIALSLAWVTYSQRNKKFSDGKIWLTTNSAIIDIESDSHTTLKETFAMHDNLEKKSAELRALYANMASDFARDGLNLSAIQALTTWFYGASLDDIRAVPWPRRYEKFDPPLLKTSVRVVVVPYGDIPEVAVAAAAITRDVIGALPFGTKIFANQRSNYHSTVFHTSYPSDTRPAPWLPDGGIDGGGTPSAPPPSVRRGPTEAELIQEFSIAQNVIKTSPAPTLRFERVVMTPPGTLLITWTDPSGNLERLRRRFHEVFPGATQRQANIIHTSLLRVFIESPLPLDVVKNISSICDEWTQRLRNQWGYEELVPAPKRKERVETKDEDVVALISDQVIHNFVGRDEGKEEPGKKKSMEEEGEGEGMIKRKGIVLFSDNNDNNHTNDDEMDGARSKDDRNATNRSGSNESSSLIKNKIFEKAAWMSAVVVELLDEAMDEGRNKPGALEGKEKEERKGGGQASSHLAGLKATVKNEEGEWWGGEKEREKWREREKRHRMEGQGKVSREELERKTQKEHLIIPKNMWYVVEEEFSTLNGHRYVIPLIRNSLS